MTAASATVANVSRAEFEDLGTRTAALERSRETAPATQGEEFVRQAEFRLFKWVAASFAALTLAGFGVLYEMMSDLQVDMERGFRELQVGTERTVSDLRVDMEREFGEVQREFGDVRERLVRIETQLEGVRGRLDEVESRLDGVEERLEGVGD